MTRLLLDIIRQNPYLATWILTTDLKGMAKETMLSKFEEIWGDDAPTSKIFAIELFIKLMAHAKLNVFYGPFSEFINYFNREGDYYVQTTLSGPTEKDPALSVRKLRHLINQETIIHVINGFKELNKKSQPESPNNRFLESKTDQNVFLALCY